MFNYEFVYRNKASYYILRLPEGGVSFEYAFCRDFKAVCANIFYRHLHFLGLPTDCPLDLEKTASVLSDAYFKDDLNEVYTYLEKSGSDLLMKELKERFKAGDMRAINNALAYEVIREKEVSHV